MPFFACILLLFSSVAWAGDYAKLSLDSVPIWRGVPFLKQDSLKSQRNAEPSERDTLRLQTRGSKTIQVTVGDGGTEVDQELRLSVQGEATRGVYIDALLSDVGREAGSERTATLQEVDEVHFRVESERLFLHLGDMTWKESALGFSGLERATLGVAAGVKAGRSQVRGAYGYDELHSVYSVFRGVDGQQKGYLLSTGTTESYLAVVPNSETVYLNGIKLNRQEDYVVNYAGGVLDFLGTVIPGAEDEIRVEFQAYNSGALQILKAADGKYRGKNLWLDIVGLELSSDTARMRRNTWSEEDLKMLRQDDGSEFERDDSLGMLERPWMLRRLGSRLRAQWENHYYIDAEIGYSEADTNTLSHRIGGPSGRAYRWFLSTDSTESQRYSRLRLSLSGDYLQEGFLQKNYQGTDRNWDSYRLQEFWDLDSSKVNGSLRYDEIALQIKLPSSYFWGTEWGYRRSLTEEEKWNSSRTRSYLLHKTNTLHSEISFVRIASFNENEMERYQGIADAEYTTGMFRPFGYADYGIWKKNSERKQENRSEKTDVKSGLNVVGDNWNTKGTLFGLRVRTGENFETLEDSLRVAGFEHSANYSGNRLSFGHVLQYKRSDLDTAGASNAWLSEESVEWGDSRTPFVGKASYRLGLTREVPYVPIYKAVAKGTGDVMFDSIAGVFVEGVDNGDYVYEGMGRSDSAEAVRASSASMSLSWTFFPRMLGIQNGVLRDLEFSFDVSSEGRDTTGKTLYLPPFFRRQLRDLSSGIFQGEFSVLWSEAQNRGSLGYSLGTESEKRNTSQGYFESRTGHKLDGVYSGRKKETWELVPALEFVDLETFQKMEWKIYEATISWKRELPLHLYVMPKAWIRKGKGNDESGSMDAFLRQASLLLGFDNERSVRASDEFSATYVTTQNEVLPYQMISGFGKGVTFRNSASVTVDANEFLSLGFYYVVRFGSAENGVFQKMSMEARAYF